MTLSRRRQSGVALIMGLMVLVLVTAAGVATMESSGLQLKMASANQDRQQAFEAAEAALRLVEERVQNNTDNLAENDNKTFECSGTDCFMPDCASGRCFQGIWLAGDSVIQCKAVDDGNYGDGEASGGEGGGRGGGGGGGLIYVEPPVYNAWESGAEADYLNVWDTDGRHLTVDLDNHDHPVKYIVEFLCFAAADPVVELSDSNYAQLFRITTRGQSNSGQAEVMLQSTYKRLP